jgi:hypothetical protein
VLQDHCSLLRKGRPFIMRAPAFVVFVSADEPTKRVPYPPRLLESCAEGWRVLRSCVVHGWVRISESHYGTSSKLILSHYSYAVMFLPPREKPRGVGHPQRGTLFGHSVVRVITATCAALQTAPTVLAGSDLKRRNSTCRLASTR